jgi:hypothetical protein
MPEPFQRELAIWADFNSVDERRLITASLRFAMTAERPFHGERVRLYDDEGNSVLGVVERLEGLVIHVRPEIDTWSTIEISLDVPFAHNAPFRTEAQEIR